MPGAASLSRGPLNIKTAKSVVATVSQHLQTTAGLRTLGQADAHYKPRFEGDLFERDGAYHNGTVWPWLIGAHAEATLRAGGFTDEAREAARQVLRPIIDRLGTDSVGSIPEIYDGDEPRRPVAAADARRLPPRRPRRRRRWRRRRRRRRRRPRLRRPRLRRRRRRGRAWVLLPGASLAQAGARVRRGGAGRRGPGDAGTRAVAACVGA